MVDRTFERGIYEFHHKRVSPSNLSLDPESATEHRSAGNEAAPRAFAIEIYQLFGTANHVCSSSWYTERFPCDTLQECRIISSQLFFTSVRAHASWASGFR